MRKLDNLLAGGVRQGSPVDVNPTKLVHTAVAWVGFRIELKRFGRMCLPCLPSQKFAIVSEDLKKTFEKN